MDNTCKIGSLSGRLLVSEDLTKANQNRLFALELAEAWYDHS